MYHQILLIQQKHVFNVSNPVKLVHLQLSVYLVNQVCIMIISHLIVLLIVWLVFMEMMQPINVNNVIIDVLHV